MAKRQRRNKVYSEMEIQFLRKKKQELEMDLAITTANLESAMKEVIVRPPQVVEPIPDKVWQAVSYGISELFQQAEEREIVRVALDDRKIAPALPPLAANASSELDRLLDQ